MYFVLCPKLNIRPTVPRSLDVPELLRDKGSANVKLTSITNGLTNESTDNLDSLQCKTSFVMIGLMFEYGINSGQFYQPKVNFRNMDQNFFLHAQLIDNTVVPAILNSMLKPTDAGRFDRGNPISVSFYECEEDEPTSEANSLQTLWDCSFPKGVTARGTLEGVKANNVTRSAFKRLLELFNIKQNDEEAVNDNNAHVTSKEWASFFSLFNNYDFQTNKGLREMVKVHGLKGFKVDRKLTVHQNLRMMSFWIRNQQRIRSMVSDGQHRSIAMASFLHGIFIPSPEIHTRPMNELTDPVPEDLQVALTGERNDYSLLPEENDVLETPQRNRGKKLVVIGLAIVFGLGSINSIARS